MKKPAGRTQDGAGPMDRPTVTDTHDHPGTIVLSPAKTARLLAILACGFALLTFVYEVLWRYGPKLAADHPLSFLLYTSYFHVDAERNLPTWFSYTLLLLCALVLSLIAALQRRNAAGDTIHWSGLAFLFLLFALDEATSLHERLNDPLRSALDLGGFLTFAWVLPGAVFVLVIGLLYGRFLARLPRRTRRLFLLSGALFIAGALLLEMVGAHLMQVYGSRVAYIAAAIVEEFLEMIGVIVFLYALLDYVREQFAPVCLRLPD